MFKSIQANPVVGFGKLLTSTKLWKNNAIDNTLTFPDNGYPIVIVGPNGSGKSVLLNILGHRLFATVTGKTLDHRLIREYNDSEYFKRSRTFLSGVSFTGDGRYVGNYYRPYHIPGNESFIAAAICAGYATEARVFAEATKNKSDGEARSELLVNSMLAIDRDTISDPIKPILVNNFIEYANLRGDNWVIDRALNDHLDKELTEDIAYKCIKYIQDGDRGDESIYNPYGPFVLSMYWYLNLISSGKEVSIFDEPEQCLDALTELTTMHMLLKPRPNRQVIIATHSQLVFRDEFKDRVNFIETVPGYIDAVRNA